VAGAAADGVLFNWLTPQFATRAIAWVQEGAQEAGREVPRLMAYVRTALGDEAIARLQREAATYEKYPAYAAHFRRMGTSAMGTAIAATTPDEIQQALAAWDGLVDDVVVRAITGHDTTEDVLRLVEAARPTP
jgi:alkanesulfonate monooxygenase SsuD/methylene tetrahydromethanopterin reductase-like flavin-dependent oxidoreductase (luciferase family)